MSEATPAPEAPPKPKTPAPATLKELRAAVSVMVGQKIHEALQSDAPSAAQLHVAMKWLDQTLPGAGGTPPEQSDMERAIEANRRRMADAGALPEPDLSPGDDELA